MVMAMRPTKRSCPSDNSVTLRNVSLHSDGAQNGNTPSRIRSNARAVHSESTGGLERGAVPRYFAGARAGVRPPVDLLKYWKNSPLGSRTMRSLRPRNVDLYASRLR